MNIDQNKLDELFAEDDTDIAKAKKKSRAKAKGERTYEPVNEKAAKAPETDELNNDVDESPRAHEPEDSEDEKELEWQSAEDMSGADPVPDEEKEVIHLNPGRVTNTVFDWLGSLMIALVCVLLVMTFCFRVIDVDGTSMEPTLIDTDKVIITDLFYTPHNGDIVVISHGEEYEKPLVKRIIAIPGQHLKLDFEHSAVYVDDMENPIDEPYIQGLLKQSDIEEIDLVIPEGKLFVMGDNREKSLDSRSKQIGLIDVDSVIGKAQLDIIPHSYSTGQVSGVDKPGVDFGRIRYLY